MSLKKLRKIAANNKRVAAIRKKCDLLSDQELIELANKYKEDLL